MKTEYISAVITILTASAGTLLKIYSYKSIGDLFLLLSLIFLAATIALFVKRKKS